MNWLIVGANGQLGRALCIALVERGIPFVAYGSEDLDIRSAVLTLQNIAELRPEVIVNAAAWTDVDSAEENTESAHAVNAEGALNLAMAAKAVGAVFAHVSTDYVFSGMRSFPWSEDDLRAPESVYGKTKAAGEVAVLSHYPEGSYVFRTAWLYSEWGRNFAKTMTRLALSRVSGDQGPGDVKVVDDQVGQPTYALDLANQIVDAVIAKLPFGIYHATNSGQASWFEFAQEVFKLSGAPVERVVVTDSSSFMRPAKRPAYSVLGHGSWKAKGASGVSVEPMRDWRLALHDAMPAIISAVDAEG